MKEINDFLSKSTEVLDKIDKRVILKSIQILKKCQKQNGRIFFAGSGGGAGHASHAANDFRKICNIESYLLPFYCIYTLPTHNNYHYLVQKGFIVKKTSIKLLMAIVHLCLLI